MIQMRLLQPLQKGLVLLPAGAVLDVTEARANWMRENEIGEEVGIMSEANPLYGSDPTAAGGEEADEEAVEKEGPGTEEGDEDAEEEEKEANGENGDADEEGSHR